VDFTYIAYTKENKVINGNISAGSEADAGERLKKMGYRVLSLRPVTPLKLNFSRFTSGSRVKIDTVVMFSRQMATLLNASVNIITALELLQAQASNSYFKEVLHKVIADIRTGQSLSDAMSHYPDVFPPLYCRSLKVGEQSGELARVLNQFADYLEKGVSTRESLKGALAYPAFMVLVAVVVVIVLVSFVFPTFIGLYKTMGVELPPVTRAMLSIVEGIRVSAPYLLGVILCTVVGMMLYRRTPSGKYQVDRILLKVPLLGNIILLRELASACRTMALLFHTGLPLAELMDILVESCGNSAVAESFREVKLSIFRGEGLAAQMSRDPIFLPMMVEMVKVGEETGEMDTTLLAVAQNYDAEADGRTRTLVGFIQPAVTLILGGIVFFIVLSMMSLMYSIYGQVKL